MSRRMPRQARKRPKIGHIDFPQGRPRKTGDSGRNSYINFIRRIFDRDGWTCKNPFCGTKRNPTCHHIKKRSLGGKHEDGNCVTICMDCHRANEDGRLKISKTEDSPMIVEFDDRRYGMAKAVRIIGNQGDVTERKGG